MHNCISKCPQRNALEEPTSSTWLKPASSSQGLTLESLLRCGFVFFFKPEAHMCEIHFSICYTMLLGKKKSSFRVSPKHSTQGESQNLCSRLAENQGIFPFLQRTAMQPVVPLFAQENSESNWIITGKISVPVISILTSFLFPFLAVLILFNPLLLYSLVNHFKNISGAVTV